MEEEYIRPLTEKEQLEGLLKVLYAYREYIERKVQRAEHEYKLVLEREKERGI